MKLIKTILIIPILIFFWGCPDKDINYVDSSIIVENNSSDTILIFYNFYDYPDTSLILQSPFLDFEQKKLSIVLPDSELTSNGSFIKYFNMQNTTKLMLYIFNNKTVESVPWDTIRQNYLILKRYDLSLEDLDSLNWTITYP